MFDLPDQPPVQPASQNVVLIAASSSAQQHLPGEHILGVCDKLETHRSANPRASISPVLEANSYYFKVTRSDKDVIKGETAEIRIVQSPKHGKLDLELNPVLTRGFYQPTSGYVGNDSFIVRVRGNGQSVKIHYFISVVDEDGRSVLDNKNCKLYPWKISAVSPDNEG